MSIECNWLCNAGLTDVWFSKGQSSRLSVITYDSFSVEEHIIMAARTPDRLREKSVSSLMLRDIRLSSALQSVQKVLSTLIGNVEPSLRPRMNGLLTEIDTVLREDAPWKSFVKRYDMMHGPYLATLARDYPVLSMTELRLCAFLRLPLTSKEMAVLFHCSSRSIEKHRERIRKKLQIERQVSLVHFLAARYADVAL